MTRSRRSVSTDVAPRERLPDLPSDRAEGAAVDEPGYSGDLSYSQEFAERSDGSASYRSGPADQSSLYAPHAHEPDMKAQVSGVPVTMTTTKEPADQAAGTWAGDGAAERPSAGALVSGVAADMSTLFRKEVELAKAELRQEAVKAGKGAKMFGGAAGAGYFAVLFLLLAVMFGLSEVMALGWAALIVGAVLLLAAGALAMVGRKTVKKVHPAPTQTVETIKEDVQWAQGLRK